MKRFLLITLLLCGCTYYEKPGVSAEQASTDRAACDYEATKATANGGSGVEYANVLMQCMSAKGYGLYRD